MGKQRKAKAAKAQGKKRKLDVMVKITITYCGA